MESNNSNNIEQIINKFLNIKIALIFVLLMLSQFILFSYYYLNKVEIERVTIEIDFFECRKFYAHDIFKYTSLDIEDEILNEITNYEEEINNESNLEVITSDPTFIRIKINKNYLDQFQDLIEKKFENLKSDCNERIKSHLADSVKLTIEAMNNLDFEIDTRTIANIIFDQSVVISDQTNVKLLNNLKVFFHEQFFSKSKALIISFIMSFIFSIFLIMVGIIYFSKSK
tara:strand:- start:3941 stop:4624 length:684 start_codon:yes stop_codon:yes gene_type:complete